MRELTQGKQKSIWTPANIVTCIRVALVPLWLLCAQVLGGSSQPSAAAIDGGALTVAIFFMVLSLTDKLDGYLARSRNEVTTFGKFLDPIADKLVVVVAFCYLLETGAVSAWVLLIVVSREFLVSGLRMVVASAGEVIAASKLGKWKTATTMVSIAGLLLVPALPTGGFCSFIQTVSTVLLWAAMALTLWSGADYFVKSWPVIARGA